MKRSFLLGVALLGLLGCGSAFADTINCATYNAAYTVGVGSSQATVSFIVSGLTACGGTLTVEASADSSTWSSVNGVTPLGATFTTLTADQQFRVNSAGYQLIRIRVSSTGTGSITANTNVATALGVLGFTNAPPSSFVTTTYTAPSTSYTVPNGVNTCLMTLVGGGGQGGGGYTGGGGAGGGGGGATVGPLWVPVAPGATLTVAVGQAVSAAGAPGTPGSNGTAGNPTSITGALVPVPPAGGGLGGIAGGIANGGAGGVGSGGTSVQGNAGGAGGVGSAGTAGSFATAVGPTVVGTSGGGGASSAASNGGQGHSWASLSNASGGTGTAAGGGAGGSVYGTGGAGGNAGAVGSAPSAGNYGGGGGGGAAGFTGGASATGLVILQCGG